MEYLKGGSVCIVDCPYGTFFNQILVFYKAAALAFPQASIPYERYGCIKAAYSVFRLAYGIYFHLVDRIYNDLENLLLLLLKFGIETTSCRLLGTATWCWFLLFWWWQFLFCLLMWVSWYVHESDSSTHIPRNLVV